MSKPGFTVMLNMLSGGDRGQEHVEPCIGKKIESIALENDELVFKVEGQPKVRLWDSGQSCCESRYMHTDDQFDFLVGADLLDLELKDGPDEEGEYGDSKDCQFLVIKTSQGEVTIANYNEHNGYYGGFWLRADLAS